MHTHTQTAAQLYRAWWADWKAFHNKSYDSPAGEARAFGNFCRHMEHVRQVNHDVTKPFWASGNQ